AADPSAVAVRRQARPAVATPRAHTTASRGRAGPWAGRAGPIGARSARWPTVPAAGGRGAGARGRRPRRVAGSGGPTQPEQGTDLSTDHAGRRDDRGDRERAVEGLPLARPRGTGEGGAVGRRLVRAGAARRRHRRDHRLLLFRYDSRPALVRARLT